MKNSGYHYIESKDYNSVGEPAQSKSILKESKGISLKPWSLYVSLFVMK